MSTRPGNANGSGEHVHSARQTSEALHRAADHYILALEAEVQRLLASIEELDAERAAWADESIRLADLLVALMLKQIESNNDTTALAVNDAAAVLKSHLAQR